MRTTLASQGRGRVVRIHSTALKQSIKALLTCAIVAATLSAVQLSSATQAKAATGPGSITLQVQSARSVNSGPGFVHKGDLIAHYSWLINKDDTGDPGTQSNQGIDKCLPSSAPGGSTDPKYADTCQWPSVRNTSGMAPIVAQGNETDLNDTKTLENLPAGKYLISVTADNFKIDGQHFTVDRRQPAGHRGDEPDTVAADDPADRGLQRQRAGRRHLRGRRRGRPCRLHRPPQPTCSARSAPTTTATRCARNTCTPTARRAHRRAAAEPAHRLRRRQQADRRPGLDRQVHQRPQRADQDPEHGSEPLRRHDHAAGARSRAGLPVGADHHPRGRSRPRHLEPGGRDRLRHRADQGRRARAVRPVRFRQDPGDHATRPRTVPTGEIKGVAVAGLPYIGGQNGQVVPETGFAGAKSGGPIKQPWIALSDLGAGDRRSTSAAVRRTAPSTSRTSPTAPTSSRSGTTTRTTSSGASTSRSTAAGRTDVGQQDDRRLVHPHPRQGLHRFQRQRQAGPGRERRYRSSR